MKTRQRGLRRKCRNMVRRIQEETALFPAPHPGADYWHLHLPVSRQLLDSTATPTGVRRLCAQTLIDQAYHLTKIAPPNSQDVRVVATITLPEMGHSQIIVFFGPNYFNKFFDRDTQTQRWSPLEKSLIKQWYLSLPNGFSEQGYREELRDENGTNHTTLWFIGQLTF